MPIMHKQQIVADVHDITRTNLRNVVSNGTLSELVTARLLYEH